MDEARKVRIGLVGLGFGAEFIPIYQDHPHAEVAAICQRDRVALDRCGDRFGIRVRYTDFREMLEDPTIDAIHINTPVALHAEQSLASLRAGKHTACTIPMAITVEACRAVVAAQRTSGKNYMMMETTVYTREFLYVKGLVESGALGAIQFLRGSHLQDMEAWPGYWEGFPPIVHATHAVGPLLSLAGTTAESVVCLGSGRIRDELSIKYGSPFAVESTLIRLRDSNLAAEVTRSMFETAREYVESFDVYGSRLSFEWQRTASGRPVVFRGEEGEPVDVPDVAALLPEGIRRYTTHSLYEGPESHLSFKQGSGHGGSHPHLAHEFVMSIVEDRPPAVDAATAANWSCTGVCAHESAMRGGEKVSVPVFN